jgi:hypothetical protein
VPGFSKDKTKLFVVAKKFGSGPEQNLLDQIFLVLIEKVSIQNFVSKTNIFDLFWNKSSKTKASILKERWFDIAT